MSAPTDFTIPAADIPMRGVPDQILFETFSPRPDGSWFDKCRRLEAALIAAGWTPPKADEPALGPTGAA